MLTEVPPSVSGHAPPLATSVDAARPEPKIEKAVTLIQMTGKIAEAAKANNLTWTQAYEQRQRATRITANLQKAQARMTAQANATTQAQTTA